MVSYKQKLMKLAEELEVDVELCKTKKISVLTKDGWERVYESVSIEIEPMDEDMGFEVDLDSPSALSSLNIEDSYCKSYTHLWKEAYERLLCTPPEEFDWELMG
tara:strand:+ start:3407 stop:3718 length:312 start_codon:yes stop_codon:yes gene_type:complete